MATHIGRYSVTAEIGKGGFGSVYRAHDPLVGRDVAIKLLATQEDESLVARFRAEAVTAGNLHHKNIVTIYEFGEHQGVPFLVMELLDGTELSHYIAKRTPLSLLEKVEIMSEVAEGLHFAHEHGVIHRDVKPSNIMRLVDGTVKILDFGIARLVRDSKTRLTRTGSMIGTIQYMAPEQFSAGESNAACDIWSYGAVFYELLTGIQPFAAAEASAVMYRILNQDPDPVSTIVPNCPPELDDLLHRLLAKQAIQRPQSLDDVVWDLRMIARSLGESQVPRLLERAQELFDSSDYSGARNVIRRVLTLDPGNQEAQQWRERLREAQRRSAVKPKIEELLSLADEESSRRSFAEARSKVESALQLDPSSPTLKERLVDLKRKEEQAGLAKQLMLRARDELAQSDLTEAFQLANEAANNDPENPQATALVDEIKRALDAQRRQAALRADIEKARGLLVVQAYDQAIELLTRMAADNPSSEVEALLADARRLQEAQALRNQIEEGIRNGKQLIKQERYEEAVTLLEGLLERSPEEESVRQLLSYTRAQIEQQHKSAQVDGMLDESLRLAEGRDFNRAFEVINQALKLSPGDARITQAQQKVFDLQREDRRRQEIESELARVEALRSEDRLEDAQRLAGRLATEHPGSSEIEACQRAIAEQIEAREKERRAKIEQSIKEAEALLKGKRADSATAMLEGLTVAFPGEQSIAHLLEESRAAQQEQMERSRLEGVIGQARKLEQNRQWDQAITLLEQELAQNPNAAGVPAELERLRALKAADEAVLAIETSLKRQDYDQAIALAGAAASAHPRDPRVRKLLDEARNQRERTSCLQRARSYLTGGDLESAVKVIRDGEARFPGDAEIAELKQRVEVAWGRDQELAQARQALRQRQFDEAQRIAEQVAAASPDDAAPRLLLERIAEQRFDYERSESRRQGRAAAALLLKDLRFEQAIAALENLAREYPGERDIEEDLNNARASRERHHRKQLCDEAAKEVELLIAQSNFDAAIQKAQAALQRFPGDSTLTHLLQTADSARQLRERRGRLEAAIGQLEAQFKAGDAKAVLAGAKELLKEQEEPRVRELLNWAQTSLDEARNIRKKSRKPVPVAWVAGGLVAVAALIGVVLIVNNTINGGDDQDKQGPAPVASLAIRPTELNFRYQQGGAAPDPQTFVVTTGDTAFDWVVQENAEWFTLQQAEGSGEGTVTVTVDPNQAAGQYDGVAMVNLREGNGGPLTLRVRLNVTPPPQTKQNPPPVQPTPPKPTPPVEPPKPPVQPPKPPPVKPKPPADTRSAVERYLDAAPAAINCRDSSYRGVRRGIIRWTGSLAPQAQLALGRGDRIVEGGGALQLTGGGLPGCDINPDVQTPGVAIVQRPTAANNYGLMVLRNDSAATVSAITIQWQVR